MSFRLRLACRPILGLLVRGEELPIPLPTAYVIRHNRLGTYLKHPWPDIVDVRRDWGQLKHAYRFHNGDYARRYVRDEQVPGTVVEIPLASF